MPDPMAAPMSPAAPPPGGGGGGAMMPGSPTGGPSGPGGSPVLSPGGGAGAQAAAVQAVKTLMPGLLQASMAFPAGSKEQQALIRAVSSLNPIFGKAEGTNMVPAGITQMAMMANKKGPMSSAPPPGLSQSNTPPPGMGAPPPPEMGEAA